MTTEALTAIKAALAAGPAGWANPRAKVPTPLYALDPPAISDLISSYEEMERRVKELLRIGAGMANTMYNLSQDTCLTERERQSMREQQQEWDEARRALSPTVGTGEERQSTPPPHTHVEGDDWFSQVVAFLVKCDMIDERDEYDISDVMAALADNYEPRSTSDGDAIDAIQRLMETKGLARKDIFPAKSRASEYLSRKRPLSIATIRKLHFEHGIPAEVLISPYRSTAGETP